MRKNILFMLLVLAFAGVAGYCVALAAKIDVIQDKQARQEAIMLKQSGILAVNTVAIQTMVSTMSDSNKNISTEKGFKLENMP